MQAYARAELAPAEPHFKRQQAIQLADTPLGSGQSASSALAAHLLGELDENAIGLLAERLVPHLARLGDRNAAVAHAAYTVQSLAADLGVSPKAIRCAIARGELRGVKRGSRWIIPPEAVEEWAIPSSPGRMTPRNCSRRAPKAAGPSLRSVICGSHRGGSR
jgi:excisionase family DNA binding protein